MNLARLAASGLLLCLTVVTLAQAPASNAAEARNVIREGADAKDPTIRIQAIQAAGLIGASDEVLTKLEGFLSDGNVNVRVAAVKALTDLKSPMSIPALESSLQHDQAPEVQFAAAKALYTMNDPAGRAWLLALYNGTEKANSDVLHSQARKFFGNFHSLESAGTFVVSQGLGYVPVPGVGAGFSAVTDLLTDPNLSPRAATLLMIAREKDPQIDVLLMQALKDPDWSVRASAAQMIAYTARVSLREDLVPLLTDKNVKVRFRAAGAYLHLATLEKSNSASLGHK
jgi:HEAT repeat protein